MSCLKVPYQDQNLWHLDAVAELQRAGRTSALLDSLLASSDRHSPLIGFALDGYPIYGPYGWNNSSSASKMRSGYRLRAITRRDTLPDGTKLTSAQEGPAIGGEFPLGVFAEDYEYVRGVGDLDEHNGHFARTPEYPSGTYAYYLASYPYLVGPTYYGALPPSDVPNTPAHHSPLNAKEARQIDLLTPDAIDAGRSTALTLVIRDEHGRKIRFLEKVHEQPIHLLVVSLDLAEFAHIHPELQADETYTVNYSFAHGGTYGLYADYTRPGAAQSISRFRVDVNGAPRRAEALHPDTSLTKSQDGLEVKLTLPQQVRAGQDLTFRFDISADNLQPYLGAWAHIMILSEDRQEFIHAHPVDGVGGHTHAAPGPSPTSVSTITGFRKPGLYRVWAQFQRQGRVITIPYTIRIGPAPPQRVTKMAVPQNAITIQVSSTGFQPARLTLPAGKPSLLAFHRTDAQNCASSVVFPDLGVRKALPPGETITLEIPASEAKELHFACGMNMYRGTLVIR